MSKHWEKVLKLQLKQIESNAFPDPEYSFVFELNNVWLYKSVPINDDNIIILLPIKQQTLESLKCVIKLKTIEKLKLKLCKRLKDLSGIAFSKAL